MGKILIGKDVNLNKPLLANQDNVFADSLSSRIQVVENIIKGAGGQQVDFDDLLNSKDFKDLSFNIEEAVQKINKLDSTCTAVESCALNIDKTIGNIEKSIETKNTNLIKEILESNKTETKYLSDKISVAVDDVSKSVSIVNDNFSNVEKNIVLNITNSTKELSDRISSLASDTDLSYANVNKNIACFEENLSDKLDSLLLETRSSLLALNDDISHVESGLLNKNDNMKNEVVLKIDLTKSELVQINNVLSSNIKNTFDLTDALQKKVSAKLESIQLQQNAINNELMSFYERQNNLLDDYNKKQKILNISTGFLIVVSIISIVINLL